MQNLLLWNEHNIQLDSTENYIIAQQYFSWIKLLFWDFPDIKPKFLLKSVFSCPLFYTAYFEYFLDAFDRIEIRVSRVKTSERSFYNCPHCVITIGIFGLLFWPVGTFSILRTVSKPSSTFPATFYLRILRKKGEGGGSIHDRNLHIKLLKWRIKNVGLLEIWLYSVRINKRPTKNYMFFIKKITLRTSYKKLAAICVRSGVRLQKQFSNFCWLKKTTVYYKKVSIEKSEKGGNEIAIDKIPGPECSKSKFSSLNFDP